MIVLYHILRPSYWIYWLSNTSTDEKQEYIRHIPYNFLYKTNFSNEKLEVVPKPQKQTHLSL